MKNNIKKRWLEKLRSGEYKQANGFLVVLDDENKPEGFCCLGVLCEVAVEDGVIHRANPVPPKGMGSNPGYLSDPDNRGYPLVENSTLPVEVQEWAGLDANPDIDLPDTTHKDDDGVEYEDTTRYSLSELNDNMGMDFEEIADYIEDLIPGEDDED
jgi:hypothetical protein